MPRPRRLRKKRRPRPLAPVPGAGLERPPPDRWFEPHAPKGSPASRPTRKSVFPVYAGPLKSRDRGRELSGASQGETRAPAVSDRTWPDETREISPAPSGLSTAHAPTLPQQGARPSEAEATDDHKGSHRAADPGALLAGLNPSAKRLGEIFCCAASLAREWAKSGRFVGEGVSKRSASVTASPRLRRAAKRYICFQVS